MNGEKILVDAEFNGRTFKATETNGKFKTVHTFPKSDVPAITQNFKLIDNMIEDIVWTTWILQGVKDVELAKKLDGKV